MHPVTIHHHHQCSFRLHPVLSSFSHAPCTTRILWPVRTCTVRAVVMNNNGAAGEMQNLASPTPPSPSGQPITPPNNEDPTPGAVMAVRRCCKVGVQHPANHRCTAPLIWTTCLLPILTPLSLSCAKHGAVVHARHLLASMSALPSSTQAASLQRLLVTRAVTHGCVVYMMCVPYIHLATQKMMIEWQIRSTPTFLYWRGSQLLGQHSGAHCTELHACIIDVFHVQESTRTSFDQALRRICCHVTANRRSRPRNNCLMLQNKTKNAAIAIKKSASKN